MLRGHLHRTASGAVQVRAQVDGDRRGPPRAENAGQIASASRWRSLFFWVLVIVSLATIGLGVWMWQADRAKVTAQSRPAGESARPAPDFVLKTPQGSQVRLSDLRGKVVLLNFWATWCPPCKAEMPDLDALHREYSQPHSFTVLGVDVEERLPEVEAFVSQNRIGFPLVLDEDGTVTSDRYYVRGMPTSMIIDRDGIIRDSWTGRISKDAMVARLKRVW